MGEPYIRKKGKKFIIEEKVLMDGKQKTIYHKTLPPAKVLLEMLSLDAIEPIASQKGDKKGMDDLHTFAQSLLNEHSKSPQNKTPKEEELKLLWEITK